MVRRSFALVLACLFCIFSTATAFPSDAIPDDARILSIAQSKTNVATWTTEAAKHYAIRHNGQWHIVNNTSYELKLRFGEFDPLEGLLAIPENLKLDENVNGDLEQVYIVQFVTQPIKEYRDAIAAVGGVIHKFLANHSYLVRLTPDQKNQLAELPFVRWIGYYEPAFKLDENLLTVLVDNPGAMPATRLNIMVHERGPNQKQIVAERINELGGMIHQNPAEGFRMEVTINGPQLQQVVAMSEVAWVDPWSERGEDMNLAREISGANHIETVEGYTGQGVRAEVMDGNLFQNHVDFQDIPPLFHGPHTGSDSHGTGTYGIVFARGVGNLAGRGMLPDAQGIFADYGQLNNRYTHTAEIVQAPYFGVFQSNSWGNNQTSSYTSISTEMDDIIFINDLVITQSQSNTGTTASRPQAWAKNVVAVGGVNHDETLTKTDDFWNNASIGPAADGRVKPDLCHFYDSIFTTDDSVNGYIQFCCTSGATPIVAGHFGLFFQMWSEGIFGNAVDNGATVFENRPHCTTAKAMMINTADSYPFSGTNHNLTRTHQGWGMPDLERMHDVRNNIFVVDEELVLSNLDVASFDLTVLPGQDQFRATLAYLDPAGTTTSSQHRINDLTLRVIAPDGTIYWGNNGLGIGNESTSGGSPNTIDTIENVFITAPAPGTWQVDVVAFEINEDSHVETPEVDADFALVVSGVSVTESANPYDYTLESGTETGGDVSDLAESDDQYLELLANTPAENGSPLSIVILTELSNLSPNQLSFTLESNANTPGLNYTIEAFNFVSNEYVEMDNGAATFNEDETVVVSVPGIADQFVEPTTGNAIARISWRATGLTVMFPWGISIDHVEWTFNE